MRLQTNMIFFPPLSAAGILWRFVPFQPFWLLLLLLFQPFWLAFQPWRLPDTPYKFKVRSQYQIKSENEYMDMLFHAVPFIPLYSLYAPFWLRQRPSIPLWRLPWQRSFRQQQARLLRRPSLPSFFISPFSLESSPFLRWWVSSLDCWYVCWRPSWWW